MATETLSRTEWSEVAERLTAAHPSEILRWAVETFPGR